ncbi:MAG: hypothetical protein ABR907_10045 [Terracidiphilus sp.]|jgi:hypothetical protein
MSGVANVTGSLALGKGASFWAYVSPQNHTSTNVTSWSVKITQQGGDWSGEITSKNPQQQLQTPGLSGIFNVVVEASGPKFPEKKLTPQSGSKPDVGCNSNCAAMIGIVSNPDGTDANYWTVWDAICSRS